MNENVHPWCLTGKMLLNGTDRGLGTEESKTELRHDHAILMGHECKQLGQWWREMMQKIEWERRTIIREFLNIMLRTTERFKHRSLKHKTLPRLPSLRERGKKQKHKINKQKTYILRFQSKLTCDLTP